MKTKQSKPRFEIGQVVTTTYDPGIRTITITDRMWNGLTWMYSFQEVSVRLGESYLRRIES